MFEAAVSPPWRCHSPSLRLRGTSRPWLSTQPSSWAAFLHTACFVLSQMWKQWMGKWGEVPVLEAAASKGGGYPAAGEMLPHGTGLGVEALPSTLLLVIFQFACVIRCSLNPGVAYSEGGSPSHQATQLCCFLSKRLLQHLVSTKALLKYFHLLQDHKHLLIMGPGFIYLFILIARSYWPSLKHFWIFYPI